MKKLFVFSLAVLLCFSLPLLAQEEGQEMAKKEMDEKKMEMDMSAFEPPPPLENDLLKSMAGTWKGWSEGPMGKSEDWMKAEMGLNDQFLMMEVKSKWEGGKYKGMGAMTLNEDGTVAGFWIDNYREMAKGHGTIEGNKLTMTWEGKMGKGTRVTEMVDDKKFKVTAKWTMPDGTTMEESSEMMRVEEKMEKKMTEMEDKGKKMMDKAKKEKEKMTDKEE